jgi:hypothetical protein
MFCVCLFFNLKLFRFDCVTPLNCIVLITGHFNMSRTDINRVFTSTILKMLDGIY